MNPAGKLVLWLAAFLILWAALLTADQARGHDAGGWHYPTYCCHDADCAPVKKFGERGEEGVAETELHKQISIDPRRYSHKMTSPDGRMHICATPDAAVNSGSSRAYFCIFAPAGM